MKKYVMAISLIVLNLSGYTTTWDEPWQKEVIQKSDYFVFGKVISATDSLVTVEVSKSFGSDLIGTILLDDFFLLDLCSMSGGHGPEFRFKPGDEGYLFLKKGDNGNYQIPTPTSGFDKIVDGEVHATYRHTYHQAALPVEVYELTYSEIWSQYHSGSFDHEIIMEFIDENLSKAPAGFEDDELNLFFRQHTALETAYLLDIELEYEVLKKFASCDNFHTRISAIRAMYLTNDNEVKPFLLTYVADEDRDDFSKVIAIWTLWKMEDTKVNNRLWKLRNELSDEENGFGGNIMDPRVCTYLPSPRSAIIELKENEAMLEMLYGK